MGDLNAKVGEDSTGNELIVGKQGMGTCNENGELFTDLCSFNSLVIGGTIFLTRTSIRLLGPCQMKKRKTRSTTSLFLASGEEVRWMSR